MNDTNQLTKEQIEAIEQSIADIKQRKTALQRIVIQAQEEMTELGKIEYRLTKLLPYTNRIDHLFD